MSKIKISDEILRKLELSEQTVKELFVSCLKTEKTQTYIDASFYDKSSRRTAPIVQFDALILLKRTALFRYLLGQMRAVHENTGYITPGSGSNSYNGTKWTKDNNVLAALYYMSTSCKALPHFIDGEKYAYSNLNYLLAPLKPTYPPSDPKFKLEDARMALEDLGVKLPEDITHLD